MVFLGVLLSPKIWLAWPILLLVGVTFSSIALIFNALAKGYDFFTYYFTLFLTPMTFLSGVFFPREQLPQWLQKGAAFLPLSQAIDLIRPLFLDRWPDNALGHLFFLALTALLAYVTALQLTKKRFQKG